MRTLFDTDEEEIEGKASEITLSTASLLGIFFGLVLVCGVFFGFGYSMGRGTGATAQASPVPSSPAGNTGEADETAPWRHPPAPAAQQPARDNSQDKEAKAAPAPVTARPKVAETPKEDVAETEKAAAPVAAETAAQLVTSKPAAGKIAPAYQPPTDAPPTRRPAHGANRGGVPSAGCGCAGRRIAPAGLWGGGTQRAPGSPAACSGGTVCQSNAGYGGQAEAAV